MVNKTDKIRKRDGKTVAFDREKIVQAIRKACGSVGIYDESLPERLSKLVVKRAAERFQKSPPDVESIQNIVEEVLIDEGFAKAVDVPQKHKMVEKPEKEKRHYYVG